MATRLSWNFGMIVWSNTDLRHRPKGIALVSLNEFAQDIHRDITDGLEHLILNYQPSLSTFAGNPGTTPDKWDDLEAMVVKLSPIFGASLKQSRREEIARGVTLVGPHRDDLRFLLTDVDLTTYGSRGQQRTVALTLKLAETRWCARSKATGRSCCWMTSCPNWMALAVGGLCRWSMARHRPHHDTDVDAYSVQFLNQVVRYQVREGGWRDWTRKGAEIVACSEHDIIGTRVGYIPAQNCVQIIPRREPR